ncbi:MAG: DUF3473 domain-containing protein [Acetobacteraceae bacterium]
MPEAPRFPFRPAGGALWELPMTTLLFADRNLPGSGGGYFRLLPYSLYRRGLARVLRRRCRPGISYFHPWESDPAQPIIAGVRLRSRLRHRLNLAAMEGRLGRQPQLIEQQRQPRGVEGDRGADPVVHAASAIDGRSVS